MKLILPAVVLLVVVAVTIAVLRRPSGPNVGELAPAGVLQKKYGLYAENRPVIKLDLQTVPEPLRDLIPLAEKWGIGDDIIRSDLEDKASQAEKDELNRLLRGRMEQVNDWLNSLNSKVPMSNAAAAFMYMMIAHEEINPRPLQREPSS